MAVVAAVAVVVTVAEVAVDPVHFTKLLCMVEMFCCHYERCCWYGGPWLDVDFHLLLLFLLAFVVDQD